MIEPRLPPDEAGRLEKLESLNVLYTPAEERFDRITRLARRLFNTPIALVSLVDSTRQWLKSAEGVSITGTPREVSFCGHAILGDEVMVVSDAMKDERFVDNPLVTGEPREFSRGDLDHFKHVNDTHGHPAGDAVLEETARRMRASVRHRDALGRYGGEEFLIVLPVTDMGGAADTAERVRATVGGDEMEMPGGRMRVTISLGVALGSNGKPDAGTLVAEADQALYVAKRDGRNCVRLAGA